MEVTERIRINDQTKAARADPTARRRFRQDAGVVTLNLWPLDDNLMLMRRFDRRAEVKNRSCASEARHILLAAPAARPLAGFLLSQRNASP